MLEALNQWIKRPPARLLAVGFEDPSGIEAGEVVGASLEGLLADPPAEAFDMAVWQPGDGCRAENLERFRPLLTDRARLVIALDEAARPAAVGELGGAGFAILDERSIEGLGICLLRTRPTDFTVRDFEAGDEEEILRMFKPSFHVDRSLEHWRWKYAEQPYGNHRITLAHSSEGELGAHYAGYPVVFSHFEGPGRRRREKLLTGLQIGDTMTLPKFRGAGRGPSSLLGRCVRHFFAHHCEGKVAFNFGFNTGNIQKFSRLFVRAERVERVGYWTRPMGMPEDSGSHYRVESPQYLGKDWDRFFERVGPAYGLLVRRDVRWLEWRYRRCPDEPPFVMLAARRWGRLVGWGVFRLHGKTLRWCDALFHPKHVEASWPLLQAATEHPALQGAETIEAWFPSRPEWWRRQLVILGFEPHPEPDDLALMVVPFEREDAAEVLQDLYFTMGDGDLA